MAIDIPPPGTAIVLPTDPAEHERLRVETMRELGEYLLGQCEQGRDVQSYIATRAVCELAALAAAGETPWAIRSLRRLSEEVERYVQRRPASWWQRRRRSGALTWRPR